MAYADQNKFWVTDFSILQERFKQISFFSYN